MFGFQRRSEREKREQELRELVLKPDENVRSSLEAKKAIAYCEYCILTYEEWFELNEKRWMWWQKVVIVGGVVATLSGVISIPPSWSSLLPGLESFRWLRGVPAGIVTIAAGLMSSFTYREDAVRHELTANALWNELAKYQGRAEPYNKTDEREDTSAFLNNICKLVDTELHAWSALVVENRPEKSEPEGTDKSAVAGGPVAVPRIAAS